MTFCIIFDKVNGFKGRERFLKLSSWKFEIHFFNACIKYRSFLIKIN